MVHCFCPVKWTQISSINNSKIDYHGKWQPEHLINSDLNCRCAGEEAFDLVLGAQKKIHRAPHLQFGVSFLSVTTVRQLPVCKSVTQASPLHRAHLLFEGYKRLLIMTPSYVAKKTPPTKFYYIF